MSRLLRKPPRVSCDLTPFVVLLGLLPLAVSCRQVLGIEIRKLRVETPDAGGKNGNATSCGGFDEPSARCGQCIDASCCAEAKACESDVACKAAYGCIQACRADDADCATWCLGSYARPAALAALTACASSSCDAACGLPCGVLFNGSSTCDACVRASCCSENKACANDEACVDIDFCSHSCLPAGSPRCSDSCTQTYSAGGDESAARSACVAATCKDACSTENAWSCLERRPPALRPPNLDPITFTMTVVEFLTEVPYAGLTVKACLPSDRDCTAPLATAPTDANGAFQLTVPSGFNGYIDLSGSTLFPTLYYLIPPIIVSGDRGRLRLPSSATIAILATGIKVDLDPTRGHLALVPWDCTLSPAAGVSLAIDSVDSMSTAYYFQNNAPNHAATQTESEPALGGAVNLPTGFTSVRATVASLGATSSQYNFNIRAGALTAGSMPPSP